MKRKEPGGSLCLYKDVPSLPEPACIKIGALEGCRGQSVREGDWLGPRATKARKEFDIFAVVKWYGLSSVCLVR